MKLVAVKEIRTTESDPFSKLQSGFREIEWAQIIRHENIARLLDYAHSLEGEAYVHRLIFEYAAEGNLRQYLKDYHQIITDNFSVRTIPCHKNQSLSVLDFLELRLGTK
jgi:serine/threonine protein kinase